MAGIGSATDVSIKYIKQVDDDRKDEHEKVNKWTKENKIFAGLGGGLLVTAISGTVSVLLGVGHLAIPIAAGAALVVLGVVYIARRHFKTQPDLTETKSTFEEFQQKQVEHRKEISQKLKEIEPKNSNEIEIDLILAIRNIAEEIRKSPIIDDRTINEKIAGFFDLLNAEGMEQTVQEEKSAELRSAIQQVLVARGLREKGFIVGNNLREIELLEKLGFKIDKLSPYRDSDLLYHIIVHVADAELSKCKDADIQTSKDPIKLRIKEIALRERLKTIEIEGNKVQKFQAILDFDQVETEQGKANIKNIEPDLSGINIDQGRYPRIYKTLREQFMIVNETFLDMYVTKYISSALVKQYFRNENFSTVRFQDNLKKNFENSRRKFRKDIEDSAKLKEPSNMLYPLLNFFDKWASCLKHEVFQGINDLNDVLGDGVCYAFNLRIENESQLNPQLNAKELSEVDITKNDRANQAHYQLERVETRDVKSLGTTIHDRINYDVADFNDKVAALRPQLDKTLGWFDLVIQTNTAAHAISMRIDEKNNKIWLLDANVGLFEFNTDESNFEYNVNSLMACYHELMKVYYRSFKKMTISQRIPNSP